MTFVKVFLFGLFASLGFILAAFFTEFQIESLTKRIETKTGGQVLIASPSGLNFDQRISGTEPRSWQVFFALRALDNAVDVYPPDLLQEITPNTLISGKLSLLDHNIGGTIQPPDWIVLASDYLFKGAGPDFFERAFHHEYSSLLILNKPFPYDEWQTHKPQNFQYPITEEERLEATQSYANDFKIFYEQGFVSDYGASSLENDINTYAELLLSEPDKLFSLAEKYDLIRQKAKIIRDYYVTLHSDFDKKFSMTSLKNL